MAFPAVVERCLCADVLSAGLGRWLHAGPWHRYECWLYRAVNNITPEFTEPAGGTR